MENSNIYEKYILNKTKLIFLLLFIVIIFFVYLFIQSWYIKIPSNYQLFFLYFIFILNIFFIRIITKRVKKDTDNIVFSDIVVNLNLKNKKINFSQKDEIKKENEFGFYFYITITSEYNRNTLIKKINISIRKIFNRFLFDSEYDHIMAREHWYRIAYATFLYFILFIFLLEMINIGKEIFIISSSENFYIVILLLLIIDFIYIQFKNIFYTTLSLVFLSLLSLFFIFIDYKIIFNQNYSIVLMLFSLFVLLYITSIIIKIIKPNTKLKNLKENNMDKFLLIDIYFNREFLYCADNQISKKSESSMKKNLSYALIGFLFTISVPIIIEEVKTPSVIIEKNKGQTIEKNR